jgi:hypothetical protein
MADWDPLINEIFIRAIEAGSPAERAAVLVRSGRNDAELRRIVEAVLMVHDQAGCFLDHPAPGLADARPVTTCESLTLSKDESAARLVGLYEAWGQPEEAEEWRRKLGPEGPPPGPSRR